MAVIERTDAYLLGGVAIAGVVLFSEPLARLLVAAHAAEGDRGVQWLPASVVLVVAFVFHQQRKRHEAHVAAAAVANDARQADTRAAEMARLVAFGQALALSLDEQSLHAVAAEHLPSFSPDAQAAASALLAVSLKNAQLFQEVRDNSVKDSLTGCVNRKHALEVMATELRRARRSKLPLSLVMFDIDRFKAINDRCGHLCGDAVLAAVGQRMHAVLRGSDLKCRYGGEEFLVVLPETPLAGAQRVAETLRRELEATPIIWRGETVRVTASFGVTMVAADEFAIETAIDHADAAMYRAKERGRNRVHTAHTTMPGCVTDALSVPQ